MLIALKCTSEIKNSIAIEDNYNDQHNGECLIDGKICRLRPETILVWNFWRNRKPSFYVVLIILYSYEFKTSK